MPSESKKQRPAPGSMYFPPPAAAALAAPSAPAQSPMSTTSAATTSSPRANSSSSSGGVSAATTSRALTPNKHLGELLRALEPRFCFHPAVEELLLDMASEFVRDVVDFSGRLAKHRRSVVLEPRDLQFCLAKNYGISLAGALPSGPVGATAGATPAGSAASVAALQPLGQDLLLRARPAKNSLHMHRLALKRKALLRTKTKLMKAVGGGRSKASDSAAARKLVRKGSSGMDAK